MDKKNKILLLSDDLRTTSGVGRISKEIVVNTAWKYDWAQLATSQLHTNNSPCIDISADVKKECGYNDDVYVRLYPYTTYGDPEILFKLIDIEKPDAILHFTDPRRWYWLYEIEHLIRTKIPLLYLNIWDALPYPMWNKPFYESCDGLFSISQQTYNINKWVVGPENCCDINGTFDKNGNLIPYTQNSDVKDIFKNKSLIHLVPHGLNHNKYKKLSVEDTILKNLKNKIFKNKEYDFVIGFVSRNMTRKHQSDLILGYKKFCDSLPKSDADKCVLLIHSEKINNAGTDLVAVTKALCPEYNIILNDTIYNDLEMICLFNLFTIYCNCSSSEGFGIGVNEAMLCEVPILATVTGGLQDQMGFVDENNIPIKFTKEFSTNSIGKYRKCGEWAYPMFPSARTIIGSPWTPYLFDDIVNYTEICNGLLYWYNMSAEERLIRGRKGREWACTIGGLNSHNMCKQFIDSTDFVLNNFTPKQRVKIDKWSTKYDISTLPENALGTLL